MLRLGLIGACVLVLGACSLPHVSYRPTVLRLPTQGVNLHGKVIRLVIENGWELGHFDEVAGIVVALEHPQTLGSQEVRRRWEFRIGSQRVEIRARVERRPAGDPLAAWSSSSFVSESYDYTNEYRARHRLWEIVRTTQRYETAVAQGR